jgi:hypothetical protein
VVPEVHVAVIETLQIKAEVLSKRRELLIQGRTVTFQKTEILNQNLLNVFGNENTDWQKNMVSSIWLSFRHIYAKSSRW